MKKLLAFILLLSVLSAGCLFPTLGAFAMSNADSGMSDGMSRDMEMHSTGGNDGESIHQCCESPLIDSITYNTNTSLSQGDTDDDEKILYALNESLFRSSINRLNSPPKLRELFDTPSRNTYISLVGIIKNNS